MKVGSLGALVIVVLLLWAWEWSVGFYSDLLFVLPAPSRIGLALLSRYELFFNHTLVTLRVMGMGFVIALGAAFPLAWAMLAWRSIGVVLQPLFILIQCVPMFALAPIMVIWFDWSQTAVVVPTALMIFFPLTINIYQGLRAVPQHLLDFFSVSGATSWQVYAKLRFPWALPHICAGFRISAAIAGVAAIAGEWAGAQQGLGVLMLQSRREADLATCFGALFCLTMVSLGLYSLMVLVERWVSRPKKSFPLFKKLSLSLLLLGLLLTSFSKEEKGETRLLLDWLPNPNHAPLYVGVEKGFFEKEGIALSLRAIHDPGDSIPYLTSGLTELAVSYMPHTIRSKARGADVKVVGVLVKEPLNALLYRKGEGIASPADLNGRVIGYCVGGFDTLFLQTLMKRLGIVPQETCNVSFDLVTTLGARRVDATYGAYWNIETAHLHSLGIETDHFKLAELGIPNYYELIILAKGGSWQTHPDFVERFQRALQASIAFCKASPEEAYQIYLKANPTKGEKARLWEREAWLLTYPVLADDQEIDRECWREFSAWEFENKVLASPVDADSLFLESSKKGNFNAEAQRKRGVNNRDKQDRQDGGF